MAKRYPLIILAAVLLLSCVCCGQRAPRIGISSSYNCQRGYLSVNNNFATAILRCGGIPVILPLVEDSLSAERILDGLDGLVFSGGEDIDPRIYGEDTLEVCGYINGPRDTSDLFFARGALRRGLPVLGICRGHQLLNVAMGGTLYQDIPSQCDSTVGHNQADTSTVCTQTISICRGSRLSSLVGADTLRVNSFHHQAVKALAPGLRIAATTSDGVVEAVESISGNQVLGLQFHPECLFKNDNTYLVFFEDLVLRSSK